MASSFPSQRSSSAGATMQLPAITCSLRAAFTPLLQALGQEGSFMSNTYAIEVIFALVRFDSFLTQEEREAFVEAFDSLIRRLIAEHRRLVELRNQLEECRAYLAALADRCATLEDIADVRAQVALERRNRSFGFAPDQQQQQQQQQQQPSPSWSQRAGNGAASGCSSSMPSHSPTFTLAAASQRAPGAEEAGGMRPAAAEPTAPPSMQDSFAISPSGPLSSSFYFPTTTTTGSAGVVLGGSLGAEASSLDNASMTDKQAELQQTLRTSLRRRIEHGLAQQPGSWAVSSLAHASHRTGSQECLAAPNNNASSLAPSETASVAGSASTTPATAAASAADAALGLPTAHLLAPPRPHRRLSGSRLSPLVATTNADGVGLPLRHTAGAGAATAPPPLFASGPPTQQQQQPLTIPPSPMDEAQAEVSNYSLAGLPQSPVAATVEGVWEAAFWSLLNGAEAASDVALLGSLLQATTPLKPLSSAVWTRYSSGKHSGPSRSSSSTAGARQPGGEPRIAPKTGDELLRAIAEGSAGPGQWHLWFTARAVLSVLTDSFLAGGGGDDDDGEAGEEAQQQQQRRAAKHPWRGADEDSAAGDDTTYGDEAASGRPATPAVSLRSSSADDGLQQLRGQQQQSFAALREPHAAALGLLRKVFCPTLRNYKMGFRNVATAAPLLAARAAASLSQGPPLGTARPSGTSIASLVATTHGSPGAGGGDLSPQGGGDVSTASAVFESGGALSVPQRLIVSRSRGDLGTTADSVAAMNDAGSTGSKQPPPAAAANNNNNNNNNSSNNNSASALSPDSFDFPIAACALSEGSDEAVRPVDVVVYALVAALKGQLAITAALEAESNAARSRDGTVAGEDPSTVQQQQQQQQPPAGDVEGGGISPVSPFTPTAVGGPSPLASLSPTHRAGLKMASGHRYVSLPAIMCGELGRLRERVEGSLAAIASMAEQLRGEAALLSFRVISTVLDLLLPAVHPVDNRIWLFYRVWVCDLYALLQREGLMDMFTAILDQDGASPSDGAGTPTHLPDDDEEEGSAAGGTEDSSILTPPEPHSSPVAAGPAFASCAAVGVAVEGGRGAAAGDPFALVTPGSCVGVVVPAAAAPLLHGGGGAEAVVISRKGDARCRGPAVTYTRLPDGVTPQARAALAHAALAANPFLQEESQPVQVAQALLDEGTYVPLPRRFFVSRLVAASVRGMDPWAVRSLLAPFNAAQQPGTATGTASPTSALLAGPFGHPHRFGLTGDGSDGDGSDDDPRSRSRTTAAGLAMRPRTPSSIGTAPPAPPPASARRGAQTPAPPRRGSGGTAPALLGRRRRRTSASAVPAPVGEIAPLAASTIGNQKPASTMMASARQHSTTAAAGVGAVEGPALAHHHRFRYPEVQGVEDVHTLYTNTLAEAEVTLSPHDPLRAVLVMSVVSFYLDQMGDPRHALAVVDDYLEDIAEEGVRAPEFRAADIPSDAAGRETPIGAASPAAAAPQPPSSSAFSVTSVRGARAHPAPTTPPINSTAATGATGRAEDAGGVAAASALPQVPVVIPSWYTPQEQQAFLKTVQALKQKRDELWSLFVEDGDAGATQE